MAYKYKSDEWLAPEDVEISVGEVFMGLATIVPGAELTTGTKWIGLASISGKATLNAGANYIGLASVNVSPIPAGAAYIGLASVTFPGIDGTNSVVKTEQQFSTWHPS